MGLNIFWSSIHAYSLAIGIHVFKIEVFFYENNQSKLEMFML